MNINIIARVLIIAVVFLGILNQPYAYYEFLRLFVSIVSIILMIQAYKNGNRTGFEYVYAAITFIYNPVLPIHASKETWVILNLLTIIIVGISLALDKGVIEKKKLNTTKGQNEDKNTSQQKSYLHHREWLYIGIIAILIMILYFKDLFSNENYQPNSQSDYYDEYLNEDDTISNENVNINEIPSNPTINSESEAKKTEAFNYSNRSEIEENPDKINDYSDKSENAEVLPIVTYLNELHR